MVDPQGASRGRPARDLALILEIEKTKWDQQRHEGECALRYKALDERQAGFDMELKGLRGEVQQVLQHVNTSHWAANWRAWAVVGALVTLLVGMLGWTATQLYEELKRPAAASAPKTTP